MQNWTRHATFAMHYGRALQSLRGAKSENLQEMRPRQKSLFFWSRQESKHFEWDDDEIEW